MQTDSAALKNLALSSKTLYWESILCYFILTESLLRKCRGSARKTAMKETPWGTRKLQLECAAEYETYLKWARSDIHDLKLRKGVKQIKEQYKLVMSGRLSHFSLVLWEIKQKKCCCCEFVSLWEIILSEQPSAISAMSWLSRSSFHLQWDTRNPISYKKPRESKSR